MFASYQPQQPLNFWSPKLVNVKLKQSFLQKVKLGPLACLSLLSIFISYLLSYFLLTFLI